MKLHFHIHNISIGNWCGDRHLINWSPEQPINRIVLIIEYLENMPKTNDFAIKFIKMTNKSVWKVKKFKVDKWNHMPD